jgi:hypothetical protein
MNKPTKLFSTIIALTLMATLTFGTASAAEVTYTLKAGQHTEVGTVTISRDGTDLFVDYKLNTLSIMEGWLIVQAHMYADTVPPKKGAPGRFPFHSGPISATEFGFSVDSSYLGDTGDLYVAAHAELVRSEVIGVDSEKVIGFIDSDSGLIYNEQGFETVCPTLEEIAAALPVYTKMRLFGDGVGYYDVKVDLDGNGTYATDGSESFDWYCIDKTHNISANRDYTVRVFSSYETLPSEIVNNGTGDDNVDHPENLDLVNWVINNPDTPVSINQKQQQDVIWALVDDAKTRAQLDSQEVQVYDAAVANGEGFVPDDGQKLAIVLQPVDENDNSVGQVTIGQVTIGQVTFASLGLECREIPLFDPIYAPILGEALQSETGWGLSDIEGGTHFKGGWGSYFTFPE